MRGVLCVVALVMFLVALSPGELFAAPRCTNGNCPAAARERTRPPARSADKWPSRGPIRWTTGVGRWLVGARTRSIRGQ